MLDWARSLAARAIVLDGAMPGLRARELGRSARRDLAASMRRRELELAGIDLWIPADHFNDPDNCQRAMDTVVQTCELASELAALIGGRSHAGVSVMTMASIDEHLYSSLGAGAERHGASVQDHRAGSTGACPAGITIGVDPASVLIAGEDPSQVVHQLGAQLGAARLDDVNAMGRCPVGAEGGRLEIDGYKAALMIGGLDWLTVDLRQLSDPTRCFSLARQGWDSGLMMPPNG
jgi:sugar phosphate isomerase/epimerase